jgi:hypothetical protein
VHFASWISFDEAVHEGEEVDASLALHVLGRHLAGKVVAS